MIKEFINEEEGTQSIVNATDRGFSVSLKDLDSGEFLPNVRIYTKQEDALNYAKKIANI